MTPPSCVNTDALDMAAINKAKLISTAQALEKKNLITESTLAWKIAKDSVSGEELLKSVPLLAMESVT